MGSAAGSELGLAVVSVKVIEARTAELATTLGYSSRTGLLGYFYVRVRDPEVAADLLAETFAVAYERRHRFKDTGSPGGAWLYGIARKELAHYFRRRAVDRRALTRLGIAVPPLDEESVARIEQLADVSTQQHSWRPPSSK